MLNFDARIKNSDAAQPRVTNVKTPILTPGGGTGMAFKQGDLGVGPPPWIHPFDRPFVVRPLRTWGQLIPPGALVILERSVEPD